MKTIYYIIKRHNGKYKPFIALYTPGNALFVTASGNTTENLIESQKFLTDNAEGPNVFLNPVASDEFGITWLSELIKANPDNQTKEEAVQQLNEENNFQ